ncbi:MAG: signal peptidase I [Planctomycetaceae bacterium]|nr:signal peptidase I [Planctomycetaceae bacterium]
MFRQLAEAVVFLSLAVIGFRGFIAEGYMISTGSMAPCLLGFHRQIVCPDCAYAFSRGTRYDVEDTILAEGQSTSDFGVSEYEETVCPNCGLSGINVSHVPRNEGDQLLVHKHFYQLRAPRRWEVVVFRHPNEPEQAYVKRVAGLPGEVIQLIEGDVVVDGVLQRKPLAVQRSMRIGVYDNDFEPLSDDWHPRWESIDADSQWQADGAAFQFHKSSEHHSETHEIDWLAYHHWIRRGGQHHSSVPLTHWPLEDRSPESFSPSLSFDEENRRLSCAGVLTNEVVAHLNDASSDDEFHEAVTLLMDKSHQGQITDVYGYNHPRSARQPYPVHDLMLSTRVHHLKGDGEFRVRMTDGWHWFETVFDFTSQEARLSVDNAVDPLRTALMPASLATGSGVIEMSVFDRQVLVAVDGEEVFPPLSYSGKEIPRADAHKPVLLGASGLDLVVDQLQLYRDVYYTPKDAGSDEHPILVGPGELMVLGDNSPVSVDSRSWESPTIPQSLLIGKPFLVHLPSQQEEVQIGSKVRHIRIPDFSRVRYIH